jgi:O-antigen/teichoic acid export membrane protein
MAAGRLVNAATGVVSVALAARYLEIEQYGSLVTATAFASIAAVLTDLGTSVIGAREIAKRPQETERLLRAVMTSNFLLSLLAFVSALGLMFLLYGGAGNELEREAIVLLLLPVLISPPVVTAGTWFVSQQKNYLGMFASVAGSVMLLCTMLLATQLDWGFRGVVAAYVTNGIVYGIGAVALAFRHVPHRPSFDWALTKQLLKWALPLGGSIVIAALYWRIDVILLSLLTSEAEVAPYGLAFKIVDVLIVLPGYVTLTLLPEFARLAEHKARLDEVIQKAFSVMQVAAFPILAGVAVFADEVVHVVAGPQYSEAALLLQLLSAGVALSYLASVCSQGLVALNYQRDLFLLAIYVLVINVVLNLLLIHLWGARGSAVAYTATEVAAIAFVMWRFSKVATAPRFERAPQTLLAAAAMAGAGLLVKLALDDVGAVAVLLVGGPLAIVAYFAALYALKAVPPVMHNELVMPIVRKLRPRAVR